MKQREMQIPSFCFLFAEINFGVWEKCAYGEYIGETVEEKD